MDVITLDQARNLARSQGAVWQQLELGSEQAALSLDMLRREFGLGAVGVADSKTIKKDMDELESIIDERVAAIRVLDDSIKEWQQQLEQLEEMDEDSSEAAEIAKKISEAEAKKGEHQQLIDDLRPAFVSLVLRYYPTKAQEDLAEPQLRPARTAVDAAADALLIQPRVINYHVESLYLNLLGLAAQQEHQSKVLENVQQMVQREQIMLEVGLSTRMRLNAAEMAVSRAKEAIKSIENREKEMRLALKAMLGLPLDFTFELSSVSLITPIVVETEITTPDLTKSIRYQRAYDNLQKKIEDLDETSKSDTRKYRLAELGMEEAELELNNTLKDLQTIYENSVNALLLAQKTLKNADVELENTREELRQAEMKWRLGTIARVEFEQKELAFEEADINQRRAQDQHYLAYQAYLLARDGIGLETSQGM